LEKAGLGERLSMEEGLALFEVKDLVRLGQVANMRREAVSPPEAVSYTITRNINYTNICVSECAFCAFFREEGHREAYLLTVEELLTKIEEAKRAGALQILLQGGLHPELDIAYYEGLLRQIKRRIPIHLHAFSPTEIVQIAKNSGISLEEALVRLKDAGLDTIPGGGAEILAPRVRQTLSPRKCSADQWLEVMEMAHILGIKTTATMMFGHIESYEERIAHLIQLRELQHHTNGFTAFIPWTYQPGHTALGGDTSGGFDYLRTLAISRIMLDNFPNIQASLVTQGSQIAQIALKFGANDLGEVMLEENVVRSTGVYFRQSQADLIRLIEDMGYQARLRNTLYHSC